MLTIDRQEFGQIELRVTDADDKLRSNVGLKLMKLQLRKFDDSPVSRRLRRWRVLASILSGVSLGLGYAWCFLDEDQLCWHDRITHTYMAPRSES